MNSQSQFQSPANGNYLQYGQNFGSPQLPTAQAQIAQAQSHGSPCITPSYNTPPRFLNLTGSDQFSTILNRLELIDNKLTQLEDIQKKR